jgi:nicotinate-nucleotide adenylyltransferase
MSAQKQKTAVFGGTFDPPHTGHLYIAEKIVADRYADSILFMPALNPPHKLNVNYSSFRHRFNMLNEALKSVHTPDKYKVSSLEKDFAGQPSYTFNTLKYLSAENPGTEYIIIIGADNLLTLHLWYNAEELIRQWNILTYPRKGFEDIRQLYKVWDKDTADKLASTLLPFELCNISSTIIRDFIRKEKKKPDFLTNPVYEYIIRNNLYQD